MKKQLFICIIVFSTYMSASAQGPLRIGLGMDLFKSDFKEIGAKTQIGLDVNYFLLRGFAVTGGFEMWSAGDNSIVLGARYYPINPIFIRFRGLIKDNSDVSLGAGYVRSFTRNWKMDIGGDYYFNDGDLGIRVGMAYLF